MKLLSEEILKIRKEHKLTQQQFADRVYVTRQAVSKWECDKAFPSVDVIEKIKEEFNIDLNELINDDEIKSTVVSNNAAIRKLNATNKKFIIGFGVIALITIILLTIFLCNIFESIEVNMKISVDIRYHYVTWTELDEADYYSIVIDGESVGNAESSGYQFSIDKINGKKGSRHTIMIEAYACYRDDNYIYGELIGVSNEVQYSLNDSTIITEYQDILDISKNAYFTSSGCIEYVEFRTKLCGLFRINIYLNDSDKIYAGNDLYIEYVSPNGKGRILQNNGEYYFYVAVPSKTDIYDEDGDVIINAEHYTMEVMIHKQPNKKFKVEFVQEKLFLSEEITSVTRIVDTFKNAYDTEYKFSDKGLPDYLENKIPITSVSYEINTTYDIRGKILTVFADDSKVKRVSFVIFDENENIIDYAENDLLDTSQIGKCSLFIPYHMNYTGKFYIAINFFNHDSYDVDITIKIE